MLLRLNLILLLAPRVKDLPDHFRQHPQLASGSQALALAKVWVAEAQS